MDFKTKLTETMLNNGLSQSSIKNYVRNLEILNDDKQLKNITFLKNKDEIMNKILNKKPNTQRSYLISIVSTLKNLDDDKLTKLYDFYYNKMMEMNKILRQKENENEKTETQKENWIEQEEIMQKLNELVEYVKNIKIKDMTEKDYNKCLQMVVLSLYTLQPPRRNADYQFMLVVKNKVPDDKLNFLVYDNKEFWFRKYKTAKTELKDKNELIIKIDDKLMDNINLYFKFHPLIMGKKIKNEDDVPFLVNYEGEPLLNVNSITYILNRIFNKKIGASMLRHLYLSHKYNDKLEEQNKDALQMSHSLQQQHQYIKKE